MTPILEALLALSLMVLGIGLGLVLRRALPDHHLDDHAKDIVRLGAALVATITALVLGMAFLYLPIVILVIYSFNDSRLVTVWGGWSLRWYHEFFNDHAMLDAAWISLRVAAVSATIAF